MSKEKKRIIQQNIALKVIKYFFFVTNGYSNSMSRSMSNIRIWEHEWLMDNCVEYIKIHISKRQGNARLRDEKKINNRLFELENPNSKQNTKNESKKNIIEETKETEFSLPVGYCNLQSFSAKTFNSST